MPNPQHTSKRQTWRCSRAGPETEVQYTSQPSYTTDARTTGGQSWCSLGLGDDAVRHDDDGQLNPTCYKKMLNYDETTFEEPVLHNNHLPFIISVCLSVWLMPRPHLPSTPHPCCNDDNHKTRNTCCFSSSRFDFELLKIRITNSRRRG